MNVRPSLWIMPKLYAFYDDGSIKDPLVKQLALNKVEYEYITHSSNGEYCCSVNNEEEAYSVGEALGKEVQLVPASANKAEVFSKLDDTKVFVANTENYRKEKFLVKGRNFEQVITPAAGQLFFLLGYYFNARPIIFDNNLVALDWARTFINEWDGKNYKKFVEDNFLHLEEDRFYWTHYIARNDLDTISEYIDSLGKPFLEWWNNEKNNMNVIPLDLFDEKSWDPLKVVDNVSTFINLSNIFHYEKSAILWSLQERIKAILTFHKKMSSIVDDTYWYGVNPTNTNIKTFENLTYPKFAWN